MAVLGPDELWHLSPGPTEGREVAICGVTFIGAFDARDDRELDERELCPECRLRAFLTGDQVSNVLVPAPLVQAAALAVAAYERGSANADTGLSTALEQLAREVDRATQVAGSHD